MRHLPPVLGSVMMSRLALQIFLSFFKPCLSQIPCGVMLEEFQILACYCVGIKMHGNVGLTGKAADFLVMSGSYYCLPCRKK